MVSKILGTSHLRGTLGPLYVRHLKMWTQVFTFQPNVSSPIKIPLGRVSPIQIHLGRVNFRQGRITITPVWWGICSLTLFILKGLRSSVTTVSPSKTYQISPEFLIIQMIPFVCPSKFWKRSDLLFIILLCFLFFPLSILCVSCVSAW